MASEQKRLTDYLVGLGVEKVEHTDKTFLGHLIGVYRLLQGEGFDADVCQAGMFHSIYGTQSFQAFKLPVERRPEIRALIGERAEHLAFVNSFLDRASLDRAVEETSPPYRIKNRVTGEEIQLSQEDFDDLCRVHLYDWLEQVPRSRFGWQYRRAAFRRMAERLGEVAQKAFDRVFAQEPASAAH